MISQKFHQRSPMPQRERSPMHKGERITGRLPGDDLPVALDKHPSSRAAGPAGPPAGVCCMHSGAAVSPPVSVPGAVYVSICVTLLSAQPVAPALAQSPITSCLPVPGYTRQPPIAAWAWICPAVTSKFQTELTSPGA